MRLRPQLLRWMLGAALLGGGAAGGRSDAAVTTGSSVESRPEYEVRAAFLLNFARFCTWPTGEFTVDKPLVIGVAGNDAVLQELRDLAQNSDDWKLPFEVRDVRRVGDEQNCHVLYVAWASSARRVVLLDAVRAKPILTVVAEETQLSDGAMVAFYRDDSNLRFTVNVKRVRVAELQLDSRVLRVAKIVE